MLAATRLVTDCIAAKEPSEDVFKLHSCALELRTPTHIVTEKEMKTALGVTKLPRHLASIPQVLVPVMPKTADGVEGKLSYEKVAEPQPHFTSIDRFQSASLSACDKFVGMGGSV